MTFKRWKFKVFDISDVHALRCARSTKISSLKKLKMIFQTFCQYHEDIWDFRRARAPESSGMYHRSPHSLQKRSGERRNRTQHLSSAFTVIWATLSSGECELLDNWRRHRWARIFFERYKKKSKKAKKGVKIEPKKEGDKQLKQLKFLVGKKDWEGLDLFWIWRLLTCMDVA